MTGLAGFDCLDHLLVGVGDLEASRRGWTRLGFTVCPRGRHIGWGTANYCVMFEKDYIELLGIVDSSQFTNNLDRFLESRGEGLLGIALRSNDAEATARDLAAKGLEPTGPRDLKRIIELPEGEALPRFKTIYPAEGSFPGVSTILCQHLTPELVWQPAWQQHPNGTTGIAALDVAVAAPGELAEPYAKVFGEAAVACSDGEVIVALGHCDLRLATLERLSEDWGESLPNPQQPLPSGIGATLRVSQLAATEIYLKAAGVPFRITGADRLLVPAAQANGLALAFVE